MLESSKSAPRSAFDWQDLLRISQGSPLVIDRVRIPDKQIAVEGQFTLPQLAQLSLEDQVFVTAFLRSHGTIKEMEQTFGVSYPTIKARLTRIAGQLEFVETVETGGAVEANRAPSRASSRTEVLERLKAGAITPAEAIHALEALK
jgi:hypothetical protein